MNIGILPDPTGHIEWPTIQEYLEPAAKRGGVPVLEWGEQVWVVFDDYELIGAATTRLTTDGFGEVILVGGKDYRRWIHQLDARIAFFMREQGMGSVRAYGRKGWIKVLKDWAVLGEKDGFTGYERSL